jgi:Concanavalin A-like lectin/glucanases superfamily
MRPSSKSTELSRRRFLRNAAGWALAGGIFVPRLIRASAFTDNVTQYLGVNPPVSPAPYNPYPPSGWWLLNSNGNDSSGNGANLTIVGTATYVTGENSVANSALTLGAGGGSGGTYAYTSAPACNGWTSFSLSFWVYVTGVGTGAARFIEKGFNSEITIGSQDIDDYQGFFSTLGGSGFDNVWNYEPNGWYNMVYVGTAGGTQSVYLNSGLVAGPGTAGTPASATGDIYLSTSGGSPGSGETPCYMQDIRFWKNEVLNTTQIGLLYAAGAQSFA